MAVDSDTISSLCTSVFTSLDIGSDLINSLDFFGYNASSSFTSKIGFRSNNHSAIYQHESRPEIHKIWGSMGIFAMFLPGIILIPPFLVQDLVNLTGVDRLVNSLSSVLCCVFFPIAIVSATMLNIFKKCHDDECLRIINILLGAEAFFESFTQLTLQCFTILYGYPITKIQVVAISASFLMLARTSILFNIKNSFRQLDIWDTIIHSFKLLPCYVTTIIFRTSAFTLTIGYLRSWSVIPIGILFVETAILAYLMCRDVKDKVDLFRGAYFMAFSNLAVINTHTIFAEEDQPCEGNATVFIRRSSVLTFFHHTTILVVLICLGRYYPEYFSGNEFEHVILLPQNGNEFYYILVTTIVSGFYSMVLSLHLSRNVAEIRVGSVRI